MTIYGYARLSTGGQSIDPQVEQLTPAACDKVVRETTSGAEIDRSWLGRVLVAILSGIGKFERQLIGFPNRRGPGNRAGSEDGRRPKLTHYQCQEALERREKGEGLTDIARTYNVNHSKISCLAL